MRVLHFVVLIGLFPAFYCVSVPYPPLASGPVLLGDVILCFMAVVTIVGAPKDLPVPPKYVLVSLVPWLIASLSLANGVFDHSAEVHHQTTVIESHYYLRGWNIVIVKSWRPERTSESLYLKSWFLDSSGFYLEGEPLTVGVKSGALGVPWISEIIRNRGSRSR